MEATLPDDPLDPAFGRDLGDVPLAELRRRRAVADQRETACSYLRRVVQARLDILGAEQQRRAEGRPAGDVSELVARLPTILGEHVHAPGRGRLPQLMSPGEVDPVLERRLDAILSTSELGDLSTRSDDELAAARSELEAFERELSDLRHSLHTVLDAISTEVVRRYREGEAHADDLL